MEGLVAQKIKMLNEEICWEYLLPHAENRILQLREGLISDSNKEKYYDYDALIIEDCDSHSLKSKEALANLENILKDKRRIYVSYRGYNHRLIGLLKKRGFKIEELYWVYCQKNTRSFWLIPLRDPGVFFFSLNAILKVMADSSLLLKKTVIYIFFRIGILKYFIDHCLIAKRVE